MIGFLECWTSAATALLSQALAGEPELRESVPAPGAPDALGFEYRLGGEEEGLFEVILDAAILRSPLLGEGVDQKAGWIELLREVTNAACGDMLSKVGRKCHIESWREVPGIGQITRAFQLHSNAGAWSIRVRDETGPRAPAGTEPPITGPHAAAHEGKETSLTGSGLELLLDVELEAALRFGCRELPLGEILDLGAGDVVELDRHVNDPVDLIVGDRIVAQGEVVLVNGNFGLRVTQVATPRRRLESIRCLF